MSKTIDREVADRVGSLAVKALLYEVSATPKPGLVDRLGSGSHTDMDFYTFLDSAVSLQPYFREVTRRGMEFDGPPENLLATLRHLGLSAERTMFAATGGVNTHKGLIFSLGIVCAAVGYLHQHPVVLAPHTLLDCCGTIAQSAMGDFQAIKNKTHGSEIYEAYGLAGIRGEAAAGYPHVRQYGYRILEAMVEGGCSLNDAGVIALLHLMAHVEDTNLIARGGRDALERVQTELRQLLATEVTPEELIAYAGELGQRFVQENLSPGGCADLLAISYMLHFLFETP